MTGEGPQARSVLRRIRGRQELQLAAALWRADWLGLCVSEIAGRMVGIHALSHGVWGLLRGAFDLPYDRICKHEFVLSGRRQRDRYHVSTKDMAKRLLDYGFHAPTIYFPLIVEEAIMIEPTETESLQTLDSFIDAMLAIAGEAETDSELVRTAPHETPVTRLDEVTAARHPNLRWRPPSDDAGAGSSSGA